LLLAGALVACGGSDVTPPSNAGGEGGASGASGGASSAGSSGLAVQPSEIAQWPMPNSPGLGLPNPQTYDATTTPGVVHDAVTGLDWLQDPGLALYSRADALAQCEALSFAGSDDWRAPSFIELVSLFDVVPNDTDARGPSYISPTFAAEGRYWSAASVSAKGLGRLLDFTADGCSESMACSVGVAAKVDDVLGGAFCVRSSRPGSTSDRYQSNGDEVTDRRTGLTWITVAANVQTSDHAEAVITCQALGNGARLPSVNELLTILVPNLVSKAFPNWPASAWAWTSSPVSAIPGSRWAAAIGGATRADTADVHNRVQCVR
jgi:hypothetical protein